MPEILTWKNPDLDDSSTPSEEEGKLREYVPEKKAVKKTVKNPDLAETSAPQVRKGNSSHYEARTPSHKSANVEQPTGSYDDSSDPEETFARKEGLNKAIRRARKTNQKLERAA
jgi:hypothetical protein